jgi:hypothetical protein
VRALAVKRVIGIAGVVWASIGVSGLLAFAIWRLTQKAWDAYVLGLSPFQWLLTVVVCVFLAYTEGRRGFQERFSPRTAARIRYLRDHPNGVHTLLAPVFAMGFYRATRRTLVTAWSLTIGIALLVFLVHKLDQPWRGIIDAGVVVGLSWGLVSLIWAIFQALTQPAFEASPEVP